MTADPVPPPAPPPPAREPKGIIAIVTDAQGEVIATAADFDRSGYGGFELWEAQRMRAERRAIFDTLNAYASPVLTGAIDAYRAEEIFRELRRKSGHRLTFRAIGWPDDVALELKERSR